VNLIRDAEQGKPYRGLGGPDRAMLYTVAFYTGYRCGELASLSADSFDLDADPPTVTAPTAYAKNRRVDNLPLHPDVAGQLRSWLKGRPSGSVWPGTWKDRAAAMLRVDLETAGIPYRDDAGRVFDFHATRGQFITRLAKSGVHP